jgi:membrane-associated phospholipid phosphatase
MGDQRPNLILDLSRPLGRFAAFVWIMGVFSLYFPINWPWGTVHQLKTPLDGFIPLVPAFVIPYIFLFFAWGAGLMSWAMVWRPKVFLKLVASFTVASGVAYIIYILFQTTVPRPDLQVSDGFTRILKWIYSSDRRFNAFPSGHTLTTTILLLTTWPLVQKIWKVVFVCIAASIIAATLLLKQHYVPDVLAGLALGWFAFWLGQKVGARFFPPATA